MATLILGAAGAAFGGNIAGAGILGIGGAIVGRAAGAVVGSIIDQRLLGTGARAVEVGRRDQLRLMGAREGAPVARVWGQMRLGGHLIWSGDFIERSDTTTTGGKGGGAPRSTTTRYSYAVSLGIALCAGPITRIGRVWADGQVLDMSALTWQLYPGDETQLPDPLIDATMSGAAPAYRGTAYVVIEELDLTPFGNRIPQFSFEVFRQADVAGAGAPFSDIQAIDTGLGAGEYGFATEAVSVGSDKGAAQFVNMDNGSGQPDAVASLDVLQAELPTCSTVGVQPVWFADDLRCGQCEIRPKVAVAQDGNEQPWSVSGLGHGQALTLADVDGVSVFPGTPSDRSMVQFLGEVAARGLAVTLAPRVRMDILEGNGLADPWTGALDQPAICLLYTSDAADD